MIWSTLRRFVAVWIGITIGYIFAAVGVALKRGLLDKWLGLVKEDSSNILITLGVIILFSTLHSIAVMLGIYDKDKEAECAEQVVRPRDYFVYGLKSASLVWLILVFFEGVEINPIRLEEWLK